MKKYDDSLFYDSLLYICPTPSAPPSPSHTQHKSHISVTQSGTKWTFLSAILFFTIFKPFFRDKNKPRYEQQQPKKVTALCISICMCRRAFFFFAPFTIPCGSFYLFVSLAKTRNVCNDNVAFQMIANFSWKKKKDDKEEASSCLLFLCSIKNYLKFSSSWKFSCFPFTSSFFFFIKNSQHESEQALPQFSFTPLPAAEFPLSESRSEALFHFSFFYQLILFFLFLFNQSPDTDDWIVFSVRQHFPYWHPRPGKLFLCVAAHFSRPKKAQKIIVVIQK